MPRSQRIQRLAFACLAAAIGLFALSQQGCYHRVVGVRGLGGSTYDVSEPYQQNTKLDDWMYGEQRDPNSKIKPPPAPKD